MESYKLKAKKKRNKLEKPLISSRTHDSSITEFEVEDVEGNDLMPMLDNP